MSIGLPNEFVGGEVGRMKSVNQEANKAIVRRFVDEFQNRNRADAVDELVSRDFEIIRAR